MAKNNDNIVSIAGIDKAELLAELYNNSFGRIGLQMRNGKAMTVEEAKEIIQRDYQENLNFGYLYSCALLVDMTGNEANFSAYNQYNTTLLNKMGISHTMLG